MTNVIIGSRGDSTIEGGDGRDIIIDKRGDNIIDAGDGNNKIYTGRGDDSITAGDGFDVVSDRGGDNTIDVGDGGSMIWTGRGDDTITSGDGWDFVSAGNGDNTVDIGAGGGRVYTGRGEDDISLESSGYSVVSAGRGDDSVTYVVEGALDFSVLNGSLGQDTLVLDMPVDLYKSPHFQAEIEYYLDHKMPYGKSFYFCSINLYVCSFEDLVILVDGMEVDPIDRDVMAADDVATVREDDGPVLQASVFGNDDAPNGIASVVVETPPAKGTLVLKDDGSYSFDPADQFESLSEGETEEVTFTYRVTDVDGDSAVAQVTITVVGDNDAPVLVPASLSAFEDDTVVTLDLSTLGSDIDSEDDGSSLEYEVTAAPAAGTVMILNGVLRFEPGTDFQTLAVGETQDVTVEITATDAQGAQAVNTVTITVTGQNDAPVAAAVAADADEDGPTITVAADFTDVDASDVHTYSVDATGTLGTASNNGDGTFDYDPNGAFESLAAGETATDTFTYTVDDVHGASSTETVTITITGQNDGPVAVADDNADDAVVEQGATEPGDAQAAGNVLDNDSDIDANDVLTVSGVAAGSNAPESANVGLAVAGIYGSLTLDADGQWTYDLDDTNPATDALAPGEVVTETFTYELSDGQGGTDTATVSITITGSEDNRPPVAQNDAFVVSENDVVGSAGDPGATVQANLLADNGSGADGDPDGDPVVVSTAGGVAVGDVFTVTSVSTNPLANGLMLDAEVAANGDVTLFTNLRGANAFDALSPGESATVSFGYTIVDPLGETSTATATFTYTGSNDAPVVSLTSPDTAAQTLAESDARLIVSSSLTFEDLDLRDTATATLTDVVVNGDLGSVDLGADVVGMLSIDTDPVLSGSETLAQRGWTFNSDTETFDGLAAGESIDITYTFTVQDSFGGSTQQDVVITITGTNDGPVAAAVSGNANEDGPAITVAADFTDADTTDTHTYSVGTTGTQGAVTNNGDGTFDYDPNGAFESLAAGETATDTFTYTVNDGNGGTSTETATQEVTITVTGNNDAPVAAAVAASVGEFGVGAQAFTSEIADSSTVPNAGLFYVLNYDDQSLVEVFRNFSNLNTAQQVVDALGVTNGGVFSLNGNNADWGASFDTVENGVATTTDPSGFELQGYTGGSTINTGPGFAFFTDDTSNATLTYSVSDVPTPDGPTTYAITADINQFIDNSVGNIDVGAVQITSSPQPVPGEVTITADFTDVDTGDTHTYSVDDTATLGAVTDNGDGTFTYSTNGAFDLAAGELATDTFLYTVTDAEGAASTETATVTIVGEGPATVGSSTTDALPGNGQTVSIALAADSTTEDGTVDAEIDISLGAVVQPRINVVYVVDTSGSTIASVLDQEKAALDALTAQIASEGYAPGSVTISIVPFSTVAGPDATGDPSSSFFLDSADTSDIDAAIADLTGGGFTNYVEALGEATDILNNIDPSNTQTNVVYFLSDGQPTIRNDSGQIVTQTATEIAAAAAPLQEIAQISAFEIGNVDALESLNALDNTGGAVSVNNPNDLSAALLGSPIAEGTIVSAELTVFDDGDSFGTVVDTIVFDLPGGTDDPANPNLVETTLGLEIDLEIDGFAFDLGDANRLELAVAFDEDEDGIADLVLTTEVDIFGLA